MKTFFRLLVKKQFNKIFTLIFYFVILLPIFLWIKKDQIPLTIISIVIFILLIGLLGKFIDLRAVKYLEKQLVSLGKFWLIVWVLWSLFIGFWLTLNIPLPYPPSDFNPFLNYAIIKIIYLFSSSIGLANIFFLITTWIAIQNFITKSLPNSKTVLNVIYYSLPMILVWSFYLLAFFPGMMSADSMVQWDQIITGQYENHHPVFHTLLLWVFTRIYFSPVAIAIAQIVLMAFTAGVWFAFFQELGIKKWVIWIAVFVFSVVPVNGTMVNTIWKDIPYGIAVLGLTYFLLRIIYSSGKWITSWKIIILFGIVLSFVSLLRHDGLIVAIGSILLITLFYPRNWKSWVITYLIFIFLYFGITGPLYNLLDVQESTALEESSLSLYEMAAYSLPESQPDQIIKNMEIWPPNWNCSIWSKLGSDWKKNSIDKSQPKIDVVKNIITRIPKILLYNYRCERSLAFIIYDPYGEVRNASHVEVLVDPNPFGIVHDSKLPKLRDWVANFVIKTSHNPNLNWLFWRPAIFLYITFLTSSILILRNRNFRFILIIVPGLLQAITLTLIFAAPNFRYYYATYLVALITIPLIFSPKLKKHKDFLLEIDNN